MIVGGPPGTRSAVAAKPARVARSRTRRAVSSIPLCCADTVGRRTSALSSSRYSCVRARTCASKEAKGSGTGRTIALIRNGREARLALAELAARGVRRDLDPSLLAEVMDDAVLVLERLALVDLRAWEHEHAIAAVGRGRRPRSIGPTKRDHTEGERRGREEREDHREDDGAHIRPAPSSVSTVSGGHHEEDARQC